MGEVINKNRDRIVKEGTRRIKINGVVDGTDYVLTIADGQVVQFFPKIR